MKNRDKWITAAFLVFILVIPLVSLIRSFMPSYQLRQQQIAEENRAVLENNGTIVDKDEAQGGEEQTEEAVSAQAPKEPLSARLQNGIGNFTNGLFGRTKLIAFNTKLTSILTGGTYIESTQVLMGKNNMFFYKTEMDGHPLWDYMGINHFSEEELAVMAANLTATREQLADRGIAFYAMCVPNKEIIYEENMPDTIARVNEVSRGEQLADYIRENTDLTLIYPKEALLANKDRAELYYPTDTHCTQMGAFVNMQELFRAAYGTHAELDSVDFTVAATDRSGDLVTIAGLSGKYTDTAYVFDPDSADPAQRRDQKLLLVGDSFGGYLSVICKAYYQKVYWEHPDDFDDSMYEKYDPDVVIWESAERYCERFMEPDLLMK